MLDSGHLEVGALDELKNCAHVVFVVFNITDGEAQSRLSRRLACPSCGAIYSSGEQLMQLRPGAAGSCDRCGGGVVQLSTSARNPHDSAQLIDFLRSRVQTPAAAKCLVVDAAKTPDSVNHDICAARETHSLHIE